MQSNFISVGNHKIHFIKFGTGNQLLLAVHGFADRARMFAVLEPYIAEKFTVVAFDLPFHGQTEWQTDSFSKKEILEIVARLRAEAGFEGKKFSLMAFSFGARIAQALLPELVQDLEKIYLLAPDGIKTKGMAAARRTPMWLRRLLFRLLQNPNWFLKIVNFGSRLKLVPGMIQVFMNLNLTRPERLRRTFGCWFSMDDFYLGRRKIQKIYRESGLPVDVFFGEKDEMIHFQSLRKMSEALPNLNLFLLDAGHRIVGKELGEKLAEKKVSG